MILLALARTKIKQPSSDSEIQWPRENTAKNAWIEYLILKKT